MIELVFVLCTLTSLACGALLFRGYRRSRARLLMWSALCFLGMAVHNGLRLLDVLRHAPAERAWLSSLPALVGVLLLIYGLIYDVE